MPRSEAKTRAELIDPRLQASGWPRALVEEEHPYKRGRVRLIGDHTVRDEAQFVDYLMRASPYGPPLAVLEAKSEDHSPGAGLHQAMSYANDLGAPFAFSSNGHSFVEFDSLTMVMSERHNFPSVLELVERLERGRLNRGPRVLNRRGEEVDNPSLQPASAGSGQMRYYQERAVGAAIEEMLTGRNRALLALATGTGKTFIALNVVTKLLNSGYARRVLFLADRVSLRDQAYNEFFVLGNARGVVDGPVLPLQRVVHFAIYQGLFADGPGNVRVFEQYPEDYFDLIVIDECHRSGYGDWAEILDYFASAFHLGLTATPKRSDSIDTYETFAGENRDAADEPQPAFEYSLGSGIDDGFLATYRVHRMQVNVDAQGLHIGPELARGAELVVPEGGDVRDSYGLGQFEREIVVPDRTRVLCEHLAALLRRFGVEQKSIVFCVTAAHADLVRTYMQELLGPDTGKPLYAVRIVGEERDAQDLLAEFQLSASTQPVLATTVDLLTTGVNAPSVRNIVFMKPIASTTVFKQIIGRGTRLDAVTGKDFFRIIDYTNATRLFDQWDLPPAKRVEEEVDDETGAISGHVVREDSGEAVEGALVVVRRGLRLVAEAVVAADGSYALTDLPRQELSLIASATGFRRRERTVDLAADLVENFSLGLVHEPAGQLVINGVTVSIASETQLILDDGSELSVEQYIDHVGEQVRTRAGDMRTLAELWRDPETRDQLRTQLRAGRADAAVLSVLLNRPDADTFDLLAQAAFQARVQSREERARALEQDRNTLNGKYNPQQVAVVQALLDKYRVGGVDEISTSEAFRTSPFIEMGGMRRLVEVFGTPAEVGEMLRDVQRLLYSSEGGEAA